MARSGGGGFDAIIGNPPYVELKKVRDYRLVGTGAEALAISTQ